MGRAKRNPSKISQHLAKSSTPCNDGFRWRSTHPTALMPSAREGAPFSGITPWQRREAFISFLRPSAAAPETKLVIAQYLPSAIDIDKHQSIPADIGLGRTVEMPWAFPFAFPNRQIRNAASIQVVVEVGATHEACGITVHLDGCFCVQGRGTRQIDSRVEHVQASGRVFVSFFLRGRIFFIVAPGAMVSIAVAKSPHLAFTLRRIRVKFLP